MATPEAICFFFDFARSSARGFNNNPLMTLVDKTQFLAVGRWTPTRDLLRRTAAAERVWKRAPSQTACSAGWAPAPKQVARAARSRRERFWARSDVVETKARIIRRLEPLLTAASPLSTPYGWGSQPFQARGPINKQTGGPWLSNFSNATTVSDAQSRNKATTNHI